MPGHRLACNRISEPCVKGAQSFTRKEIMGIIDSGMGWAIFGSAFIFIFILLGILAESQRQKRKLEKQKMLQKERFLAMEKGLPVPEWGAGMLDDEGTVISSAEAHERSKEKFRLASLCVGLILAFCGIGMMLAFHFSSDTGFHDIDTIGLIPLMAGIGLLLFYVLTRQAKP
jgi:hypothetical protein